jgi:hypothetical protein
MNTIRNSILVGGGMESGQQTASEQPNVDDDVIEAIADKVAEKLE